MKTITCQDCGQQRQTTMGNTKYCRVCRLIRDLEYATAVGGTARCKACESSFPTIRRGDPYCGECAPGQGVNRGTCALCVTDDAYRVLIDVAVCEKCARDPKERPRFLRALRARQDQQRQTPTPA